MVLQRHGRQLKAMAATARVTVLVPPLLVLSCGCNRSPGSKSTSHGKPLGRRPRKRSRMLLRPQGRWGLHGKLMPLQHLHRISAWRQWLGPGVPRNRDRRGAKTPGGWIFKVLPCRPRPARRVRLRQASQELRQASLSPSKGVWHLHSCHIFHHSHYPEAIHGQPVQPVPVQTDRLLGRMVRVWAITLRSAWAWTRTDCQPQELQGQWQLQQKCGSNVCAWRIISS